MTNKGKAAQYFDYLVSQIHVDARYRGRSYVDLFTCLHNKEFTCFVANDDNRVADAFELRREFWGEGRPLPRTGVSVLEVIVALSRRLEFNGGGNQERWAWVLIKNLGLHRYDDPITEPYRDLIDAALDALINRTYRPNGKGGFFPLKYAEEDQRQVEIWYQMSAYINEHA